MAQEALSGIPHYYLYGDQGADVELDLLHMEPIRDRSGPNDWRIRPHTHPDHMQVLLVKSGGGTIRMEEQILPIPVPGILVVPAGGQATNEHKRRRPPPGIRVRTRLVRDRGSQRTRPRRTDAAIMHLKLSPC